MWPGGLVSVSTVTWTRVAPARREFWRVSRKISIGRDAQNFVTRLSALSWTRARMVAPGGMAVCVMCGLPDWVGQTKKPRPAVCGAGRVRAGGGSDAAQELGDVESVAVVMAVGGDGRRMVFGRLRDLDGLGRGDRLRRIGGCVCALRLHLLRGAGVFRCRTGYGVRRLGCRRLGTVTLDVGPACVERLEAGRGSRRARPRGRPR